MFHVDKRQKRLSKLTNLNRPEVEYWIVLKRRSSVSLAKVRTSSHASLSRIRSPQLLWIT